MVFKTSNAFFIFRRKIMEKIKKTVKSKTYKFTNEIPAVVDYDDWELTEEEVAIEDEYFGAYA